MNCLSKIWSFLGLRVCIDYARPNAANPSREYRVLGVDKPPGEITFEDHEGKMTNVAEYFRDRYGNLRYPRMPTLRVGSRARPIHLPVEVNHS